MDVTSRRFSVDLCEWSTFCLTWKYGILVGAADILQCSERYCCSNLVNCGTMERGN